MQVPPIVVLWIRHRSFWTAIIGLMIASIGSAQGHIAMQLVHRPWWFVDTIQPTMQLRQSVRIGATVPRCIDRNDDQNNNNDNQNDSTIPDRRWWIQQITATAAASITASMGSVAPATAAVAAIPVTVQQSSSNYLIPTPANTYDLSWPLGKVAFSLLPLAGTSTRRATIEECVVPDTMWTYDQIQGVVNVNVPVRQTVVRLSKGGLWVHNPVAPTPQLLRMMQQLVDRYGPVRHIILGTVALEHKATLGAFASNFPTATVWIQPAQWSFPLQVPIEFYGLVQRGPHLREIPIPGHPVSKPYRHRAMLDPVPEWMSDFDYEVLGPFSFRSVGGFSETAFYHKATKSLIVTDCVVSVTKDPPPIIQEDPRGLLYHARDNSTELVKDTPYYRQKGWRRMVQFGLVFFPSQIAVDTLPTALENANAVPSELRNLGQGAIPLSTPYPWSWNGDADIVNFETISQNGKLFCPPILTKLILDREPAATLSFVDRVSTRFQDMQRIIPCHINNNIAVSGSREFYDAFDPLRSTPNNLVPQRALAEDLALLQKASDLLTKYGIVAPSQVCDGEPARQRGRFNFKRA